MRRVWLALVPLAVAAVFAGCSVATSTSTIMPSAPEISSSTIVPSAAQTPPEQRTGTATPSLATPASATPGLVMPTQPDATLPTPQSVPVPLPPTKPVLQPKGPAFQPSILVTTAAHVDKLPVEASFKTFLKREILSGSSFEISFYRADGWAAGDGRFGPGGNARQLWVRDRGSWVLAHGTQQPPMCSEMKQLQVPVDVFKAYAGGQCYDGSGQKLVNYRG